jgi:hypothetical protein
VGSGMVGEGSGGGGGTTNSGAGDWSSAMIFGAGLFGAAVSAGGLGSGSTAAVLAGGLASATAGLGTAIVGTGGAGGGGSGWLKLTTAGAVATAGSTGGCGAGGGGEGMVDAALSTGRESWAISGSTLRSGGGAEMTGALLAAGAGASATSSSGAMTRRTCQGKAMPGSPNSSPVRVRLNRRAWMAVESSNAKRRRRAGGRAWRTVCRPSPSGSETCAGGRPDGRCAALPDSARLKRAPPSCCGSGRSFARRLADGHGQNDSLPYPVGSQRRTGRAARA